MPAPRSVTQVENSILGPIEGFLVDRFGPRRMVAIGSFIMGLGLIRFGLTHSLWMYYLSNIIIAFACAETTWPKEDHILISESNTVSFK